MKALVVWGGWEGHEPENVANFCAELLTAEGVIVEVTNNQDRFKDIDSMLDLSLIVPVITMGRLTEEQRGPIFRAVSERGVAVAGCHGGMCDAFREDTEWQFMTGGQWVAHPGDTNVTYKVEISDKTHPITAGIEDFWVTSEQYYLHTDPGNNVLATCSFPTDGVDGPHVQNPCKMPTVWTKYYGKGRIFYNALGHTRATLEAPEPKELMRRGFLWTLGKL